MRKWRFEMILRVVTIILCGLVLMIDKAFSEEVSAPGRSTPSHHKHKPQKQAEPRPDPALGIHGFFGFGGYSGPGGLGVGQQGQAGHNW